MKNFKQVCLMAMTGLFLFLGGCQKEAEDSSILNFSDKNNSYIYKPYFNDKYNGNSFSNENTILSPNAEEVQIMTETMKLINLGNSYISSILKAKNENFRPLLNYSIKLPGAEVGQYIILVPLVNDSLTGYISLYQKDDQGFNFYLLDRKKIIQHYLGRELSDDIIADIFLPINYFNAFDFHIYNTIDENLNDWVLDNIRKIDGSGPRCIVTTTYWWGYGVSGGTPFQAMSGTSNVTIDCSMQGDGWDSWGHHTGGIISNENWNSNNTAGNNSGVAPILALILEKLPYVDKVCLSMLTPDMKDLILNMTSPCDQEFLNRQITNAINTACEEAKNAGGDNFTMNFEMWEFSQNVKDALEGVDYINIPLSQFNDCPLLKCLLKNLKEEKISDNLSNRICNIFQPASNPKILNISMNAPAFASEPNGIAGATVITTPSGKIQNSILINPNNCNLHNDPLKLLTSIQHELVHVDIHNKLLSIYGWNGSDATMQAAFDAMVAAEYPGKSYANHHQLILGEYLNEMLEGIKQANGGLGLPPPNENDIYLGIVLDAFPEDLAFISNTLGYTKADIDKFVKNFNTWIPSNKSASGIYQTCP